MVSTGKYFQWFSVKDGRELGHHPEEDIGLRDGVFSKGKVGVHYNILTC